MRRVGIAGIVWVSMLAGTGVAHADLSGDVRDALWVECDNPARFRNCLNALYLFAVRGVTDPVGEALQVLGRGSASDQSLYSLAVKKNIKLASLLAAAAFPSRVPTVTAGVDSLFTTVGGFIADLYNADKDTLSAVDDEYLKGNYLLGFYRLLSMEVQLPVYQDALSVYFSNDDSDFALLEVFYVDDLLDRLEQFRMCYGLNSTRLLKLVHQHYQ